MLYSIFEKKYLILILFTFFALFGNSQNKITLWDGTDKFEIGADVKSFGNEIEAIPPENGGVDSFCIKGKAFYYYLYKISDYGFGGLKFKNVMLWFDEKNKLRGIEFSQIYKLDSVTTYETVQANAVSINKYLQNVLKKKGLIVEDNKYQNSRYKKLQWKKKNRTITLYVQMHNQDNIETVIISYGLSTIKCVKQ